MAKTNGNGDVKTDDKETRRYLILDERGEFILEVPDGHHLTFGAVNPGVGNTGSYERGLHCLRVWEGSGNSKALRAVFGGVRGFRDLSIPLARKVNKEVGNSEWTMDSAGNFDRHVERKILPGSFESEPSELADTPF